MDIVNNVKDKFGDYGEEVVLFGNQNGMEHGIGLKRIREIVERHFGIMEILPEKEMFSVNILIEV